MESISTAMSGGMEAGKPLISVLMAVYEPNMDWLREQLNSLEAQTYPSLRLYIQDDCSPAIPFGEIKKLVQECIHTFPCEISRNEKNLGSNGTFERLTGKAEGEYFAYCDQDDIWLPEKLAVLQKELEDSGALLVCSDMYIIDTEGNQVADSITEVRRHHRLRSGTGLVRELLFHNFVTGCTMLVRAEAARAALPFCPYMVHDHYIALRSAEKGAIRSVLRPLIRYRIHGANQTNVLAGATDKKSYGQVRINAMTERLHWLEEHVSWEGETRRTIQDGIIWSQARERNWSHLGGKLLIWKYRSFNPAYSWFELFAAELPEKLFQLCLMMGKHNWI